MIEKARVYFVADDLEVDVAQGTSLVQVVDLTGADVTLGCRSGTCGTCRVRIKEGVEHLSPKVKEESDFLTLIGAGSDERLACQVKVLGDCQIEGV